MKYTTNGDIRIKGTNSSSCPFGSIWGFPYQNGFKTVHGLTLKPLIKNGRKWNRSDICSGHNKDFEKYLQSEHPQVGLNKEQFNKYLDLEVNCRTHNLSQVLQYGINLYGKSVEDVKKILEEWSNENG